MNKLDKCITIAVLIGVVIGMLIMFTLICEPEEAFEVKIAIWRVTPDARITLSYERRGQWYALDNGVWWPAAGTPLETLELKEDIRVAAYPFYKED